MRMRKPQSSGANHLNLCHIVENSAKAHPISHSRTHRNSCASRAASIARLHVDEMLQPGPLIANTKTRFVWLIWSCITHEWKFVLLAVAVTTQLLHWRLWENGVLQSIMPHLLHIYCREKRRKKNRRQERKSWWETKQRPNILWGMKEKIVCVTDLIKQGRHTNRPKPFIAGPFQAYES